LLLIPAVTGAIILSREIVSIFLDDRYFDAHILFFWICTATFFVSINHLYTRVFELKNSTVTIFWISLCAATSNIFINILLIPKYGYIGGAISTMLAYLIQVVLTYYEANKLIKFRIPVRSIINACIGSFVMCLFIIVLSDYIEASSLLAFIFKLLTGIIVYLIALFILREPLLMHISMSFKTTSN
jgi:O-antigen/teichoic acid export membrane protein